MENTSAPRRHGCARQRRIVPWPDERPPSISTHSGHPARRHAEPHCPPENARRWPRRGARWALSNRRRRADGGHRRGCHELGNGQGPGGVVSWLWACLSIGCASQRPPSISRCACQRRSCAASRSGSRCRSVPAWRCGRQSRRSRRRKCRPRSSATFAASHRATSAPSSSGITQPSGFWKFGTTTARICGWVARSWLQRLDRHPAAGAGGDFQRGEPQALDHLQQAKVGRRLHRHGVAGLGDGAQRQVECFRAAVVTTISSGVGLIPAAIARRASTARNPDRPGAAPG